MTLRGRKCILGRVQPVNHMKANAIGILRVVGFLIVFCSALALSAQVIVSKAHQSAIAMWNAQIPSIEKALIQKNVTCPQNFDLQVLDAFGLTENDPSVALIDYCAGGAYTNSIIAMRMEDGQPVIARFRNGSGQNIPKDFASGASAMHRVDVWLDPEKKAIDDGFADDDSQGKLSRCGVKAYVWNAKTSTFDEDQRESRVSSKDYCLGVRQQQSSLQKH